MNTEDYIRAIIILITLIAFFGLLAFLIKKSDLIAKKIIKNDDKIILLSCNYIDPKRKLVVIKRKNKEYFILCSQNNDLLLDVNKTEND